MKLRTVYFSVVLALALVSVSYWFYQKERASNANQVSIWRPEDDPCFRVITVWHRWGFSKVKFDLANDGRLWHVETAIWSPGFWNPWIRFSWDCSISRCDCAVWETRLADLFLNIGEFNEKPGSPVQIKRYSRWFYIVSYSDLKRIEFEFGKDKRLVMATVRNHPSDYHDRGKCYLPNEMPSALRDNLQRIVLRDVDVRIRDEVRADWGFFSWAWRELERINSQEDLVIGLVLILAVAVLAIERGRLRRIRTSADNARRGMREDN